MFGFNGLVVICNLAKKISDNLKIAISLYSKCVKSGAKTLIILFFKCKSNYLNLLLTKKEIDMINL